MGFVLHFQVVKSGLEKILSCEILMGENWGQRYDVS